MIKEVLLPFDATQYRHLKGHDCAPEVAFLLEAVEHKLSCSNNSLDPSSCDITRLFELSRLNKLLNFLPRALQSDGQETKSFLSALDKIRLQTMSLNSYGMREAGIVTKRLKDANIPHLHFKGPLQQKALYDVPYIKPSGDIDILVAPDNRRRATRIMLASGYSIFDAPLSSWWWRFLGELHLYNPDNQIIVDLHHGLQQAGLPRPLKNNGVLARRIQTIYKGHVFEVPCPADRVIISAISIAKALRAHEPCLSNVIDMRAAISRLSTDDCATLTKIAYQSGMQHTVALGLRCIQAIFPNASCQINRVQMKVEVFTDLTEEHLNKMVITPWVETISWPRNRRFILELSGGRSLRAAKEGFRLVLSEGTRKALGLVAGKDSVKS